MRGSWFSRLALRTKIIYISGAVVVAAGIVVGVLYLTGNNIFASTATKTKQTIAINNWDQAGQAYFHQTFGNDAKFRCSTVDVYLANVNNKAEISAAVNAVIAVSGYTAGASDLKSTIDQLKGKQNALDLMNKTVIVNSTWKNETLRTACDRGDNTGSSINYNPLPKIPSSYNSAGGSTTGAPGDDGSPSDGAVTFKCAFFNSQYSWMTADAFQQLKNSGKNIQEETADTGKCGTKPTTGTSAPQDAEPAGGTAATGMSTDPATTGSKICVTVGSKKVTYNLEKSDGTYTGEYASKPENKNVRYSSWISSDKSITPLSLYAFKTNNNILYDGFSDSHTSYNYTTGDCSQSGTTGTTDQTSVTATVKVKVMTKSGKNVNRARVTVTLTDAKPSAVSIPGNNICLTSENGECEVKPTASKENAKNVKEILVNAEKELSGTVKNIGNAATSVDSSKGLEEKVYNIEISNADLTDDQANATADYTAAGAGLGAPLTITVEQKNWPGGQGSVVLMASRPSKGDWTLVGGVKFTINLRSTAAPKTKTGKVSNPEIAYAADATDKLKNKNVSVTVTVKDQNDKPVSGADVHYRIYTNAEKRGNFKTANMTDSNGRYIIKAKLGSAGGNTLIDTAVYNGKNMYSDGDLIDKRKIGDLEGDDYAINYKVNTSQQPATTGQTTLAGNQTPIPWTYSLPYDTEKRIAPYNSSTFEKIVNENGYKYSYDISATAPDNGTNSGIILSNLPTGVYNVTLSKSGYSNTHFMFQVDETKDKPLNFRSLPIIPESPAEPPSIEAGNITKEPHMDIYHADVGSVKYAYVSRCPWYGWQEESKISTNLSENKFICVKPVYPNGGGVPSLVGADGNPVGGINSPEVEKCIKGKMESLNVSAKGLKFGDILGILGGAYLLNQSQKQNDQWVKGGMVAGGIAALYYTAKNTKSEWNVDYNKYEECLSKFGNFSGIPTQCNGCKIVQGIIPVGNCPALCVPFSPGLAQYLSWLPIGTGNWLNK